MYSHHAEHASDIRDAVARLCTGLPGAPVSTDLVLVGLAEQVLGLPRSY